MSSGKTVYMEHQIKLKNCSYWSELCFSCSFSDSGC